MPRRVGSAKPHGQEPSPSAFPLSELLQVHLQRLLDGVSADEADKVLDVGVAASTGGLRWPFASWSWSAGVR